MAVSHKQLIDRHRVEEEYHDRVAGAQPAEEFWSFGALDAPDAYLWQSLGDLRGKRVLEIGCGDGETTERLARAGAIVTAIDISSEMVALTAKRCSGLSVTAVHMAAEELSLPRETFDVVYGHSVVHHLDQSVAIPQIAALVKSGGRACFLEPLDHNPVLNLLRKLTPNMRTPTEKPVSLAEIDAMSRNFRSTSTREFHLVALVSYFWFYVIRNRSMFKRTLNGLTPIDGALFTVIPALRRYAWVTVLTFTK